MEHLDLGTVASELRPKLILADQPDYDRKRRVWNGLIDRRPLAIVHCEDRDDVRAALRFSQTRGLPVSIRGGGHSVAGYSVVDDGIVIDLSALDRVSVDPAARIAYAGGGTLYRTFDATTQGYGLATPGGVFSETGIAGLTLSGGYGWLTRRFGLACDNLIGAEVVTASGDIVRAGSGGDPELLWALRGGGGNFGVVTEFEYAVHEVGPSVASLFVAYPMVHGKQVMRFLREYMRHASEDLAVIAVYWTAGDAPGIPDDARGEDVVVLIGCQSGPLDEADTELAPLRAIAPPLFDLSGHVPYVAQQRIFDEDYPDGRLYYWKSVYVRELSDELIDLIDAYGRSRPSSLSSIDTWFIGGGAVSRFDQHHSPLVLRHAACLIGLEANWNEPSDTRRNIAWARDAWSAFQPFGAGAYLNFAGFGEERASMQRAAYGDAYDRLRTVKRKYDPQNVLRSNLNIPP